MPCCRAISSKKYVIKITVVGPKARQTQIDLSLKVSFSGAAEGTWNREQAERVSKMVATY